MTNLDAADKRIFGIRHLIMLLAGLAFAIFLGRAIASFYFGKDICVSSASLTSDEKKIESALAHLKSQKVIENINKRQRAFGWPDIEPQILNLNKENCCAVSHRGSSGDNWVNFSEVFQGGMASVVVTNVAYINHKNGSKEFVSVPVDLCGNVFIRT